LILKEGIKRIRGSAIRLTKPVDPFDLSRIGPVSREFGIGRGTPIDRRYIEQFLDARHDEIRGRTMEIADATYTKRFGGDRVTAIEVLHATAGNPKATLVGDLTRPEELPENWVDCFVCTQTLNFIFDFQSAIRGLHRLLKPGGKVLTTLAGISQISRYDMDRWGDYWRFTTVSARKAFEAVFGRGVEVASFGNALAATAFLQGLSVQDLPDPSLLDRTDPDYQLIVTVVATKAAA
jgi:SAM-dependent methyltransferase